MMKTSFLTLLTLLTSLLATGCSTLNQPLESEPYAEFGEGTVTLGGSTGWAFYGADAEAAGKSGVLTGETGTDSTTLTPNYGGALKMGYMVTDHIQLGGIVELRSFEPESIAPLSATLTAGDFETWHLILSSRYFFDPMGDERRWRPFAGIDLSYIPDVPLGDVKVDYPDSSGFPDEFKNVTGSDYWAIGAVAGMNYLITDHLTFDMGAFYEYAINTSGSTVAFDNLGGAEAELALRPQGLIVFFGLTYAF